MKRYEPAASDDLNRASVEPLGEVIDFWHRYANHLAAAEQLAAEDKDAQ